jgi:hypothetical protein
MKNKKMFLFCAVTVIIMVSSLIIYDCLRPRSLDAQTCVSIKPKVTLTRTSDTANSTTRSLGCHHYCAMGGAWGLDNGGGQGFEVYSGATCGDGQYNWSVRIGYDVNRWIVNCMDVTN